MQVVDYLVLDAVQHIVSAAAGGAILFYRDRDSVLLTVGALLSRSLVIFLKRLIAQPRPDPSLKRSEGFPSSHATLLAYFATVLAHPPWLWSPLWLSLVLFVLLAWRVKARLHSPAQIAAGVALGLALGHAWTLVCSWLPRDGPWRHCP